MKSNPHIVTLPKELRFLLFALACACILWPAKVEAATISVAAGSDAINSDSICQLHEALVNISDGARTHADCVETGSYGSNDTITLPTGTITGTGGSGFPLNKPAKVVGQGKGVSILNNSGFTATGGSGFTDDFTFEDFTALADGMTVIVAQGARNVTLQDMEFELTDTTGNPAFGLQASGNMNVNVYDSYFKGVFSLSGSGFIQGMGVRANDDAYDTNLDVERSTFSGLMQGIGLISDGSSLPTTLNAVIKNSTMTGLRSLASFGSGYGPQSAAGILVYTDADAPNQAVVNYTTINNTFGPSAANSYAVAIMEANGGDAAINHTAQNDLYATGGEGDSTNYHRFTGSGSGISFNFNTTSNGGNVSSDNSLSTWLNQSTDKHGQTSLASFLGALSDNGGAVPTLALLEGSPAINAGTNVAGLTTDAKGGARVLGAASDAGAYESTFGSLAGNSANNNGAVPGVPKTGFALLLNNPLATLAGTTLSATLLWFLSRRIKLRRFW